MNFGHVYITRFKLLMVLALLSGCASASGLETKESLQIKYIEVYDALNQKVGECSKLKKQRQITIDDEWLKSQPTLTQKVVLFELSKMAEKRCAQPEESDYVNVIFDLAVFGEADALNEYIELRRYDLPQEDNKKILSSLDQEQLRHLSTLEKYQAPFNLFSAFESN
ncbi:hypothetical protein [Vibrio hepatarius]|uniref:hypothetical protein n=1 Tax=Vibrio hepatarius TaxID=171383 RepID=UPI003734C559